MTANDIKFRCSSLGYIMPGPRGSMEKLADGEITHLVDVFVSAHYKRRVEAQGKMLEKGNVREEDSITLVSRINERFYKKNDIRLQNDFISGEVDIYEGESVDKADHTLDTKTSWSANTFFRVQKKALEWNYEWQGHGYLWLTGAKKHTVAYCLVNGTPSAIMDEKRKLQYYLGIIDPTSTAGDNYQKFKEGCRQIEINHIFDRKAFEEENPWFEFDIPVDEWTFDIPMKERLHQFTFERDEEKINQIRKRVQICREWMDKNLFNIPEPEDIAELPILAPQKDYSVVIQKGKELKNKVDKR